MRFCFSCHTCHFATFLPKKYTNITILQFSTPLNRTSPHNLPKNCHAYDTKPTALLLSVYNNDTIFRSPLFHPLSSPILPLFHGEFNTTTFPKLSAYRGQKYHTKSVFRVVASWLPISLPMFNFIPKCCITEHLYLPNLSQ